MKKITILAISMFAAVGAFAQFNQGRMLVGGSAELSTNTYKDKDGGTTVTNGTSTSLSISPSFGYFVIDNLAVGASLGLGFSKWNDKRAGDGDYTTSSLRIEPFVRYYLPLGIFFQGKFGIGTTKYKYDDNAFNDRKTNSGNLAVSAGYAIFLTDNIALEPELGYRVSRSKYDDSDEKSINGGIFMRIGFQIYLGNKE
jgi:outer membrane protein